MPAKGVEKREIRRHALGISRAATEHAHVKRRCVIARIVEQPRLSDPRFSTKQRYRELTLAGAPNALGQQFTLMLATMNPMF